MFLLHLIRGEQDTPSVLIVRDTVEECLEELDKVSRYGDEVSIWEGAWDLHNQRFYSPHEEPISTFLVGDQRAALLN